MVLAAALQTARNAGQKHLSASLSTLSTTWVRFGFGLPFAAVYVAILWKVSSPSILVFDENFLPLCFLASLCQLAGTALLIVLFRLRNFAIGSTYVRSEAIIAAFVGVLFFEEILDFAGWIAVTISVSGVILISIAKIELGAEKIARVLSDPSAGIGLLCGLSFGVGSFFIRQASLSFENPNFLLTAAITLLTLLVIQTFSLGLCILIWKRSDFWEIVHMWRPSLFVGITSVLGSIGWFTAMTIQLVAYVKALAQIEFIFALLVSWFIFGERSSKFELLGIVLVAAGILVLVLFAR
ncbi:MAG: hypothetical protein CMM58_03510 [Rhodospirillaceae bacterium]|nr:hypothetical protein [Rhodospirillaceae bacterium]